MCKCQNMAAAWLRELQLGYFWTKCLNLDLKIAKPVLKCDDAVGLGETSQIMY